MTPDDIAQLEAFQIFCEEAATRGGSRFVVDHFSIASQSEGGNKAVGKVYMKTGKDDNEIPLEMEWNMTGDALKIGGHFDLVLEEIIDFT